MGWFLSGTLIGPAIGPFIGGIIVTYTDWTVIFWVQAGLAGLAALGAFVVLPETIHHKKYDDLEGLSTRKKASVLANMINPWRVIKLFLFYPNLYVENLEPNWSSFCLFKIGIGRVCLRNYHERPLTLLLFIAAALGSSYTNMSL